MTGVAFRVSCILHTNRKCVFLSSATTRIRFDFVAFEKYAGSELVESCIW